jgi:acyl-coenzyme A thioesterase PaaI-like protein
VLDATGGFAIMLALAKEPKPGEKDSRSRTWARSTCASTTCARVAASTSFRTAKVVRLGNRIAVTHMELSNDEGELISTGAAAYVVG